MAKPVVRKPKKKSNPLKAAGVTTIVELAEREAPVPKLAPETLARLQVQARLQAARRRGGATDLLAFMGCFSSAWVGGGRGSGRCPDQVQRGHVAGLEAFGPQRREIHRRVGLEGVARQHAVQQHQLREQHAAQ